MKPYEVTISKVVYRTTEEFNTNEEARMWAMAKRDRYKELSKDNKVEYFYDLEEVSNV